MSNVAPGTNPGSASAQPAQPNPPPSSAIRPASNRKSRCEEIGLAVFRQLIIPAILLLLASIAAQLKLLGLLNKDWADFSWGISQNLVAGIIVLLLEIPGAVRLVDSRRLVSSLRQTMEDVSNYDLAKIDQDAFRTSKLDRKGLEEIVTRMLADSVRARSRLDLAVGRIIGAAPETNEEIDIQPRAPK